jgi:GNAT superfamily N-acetyltransferase
MSIELRARAATAIMELAFNPHQRRDSRGRWTKMPDSERKTKRRTTPTRQAAFLRGAIDRGLERGDPGALSAEDSAAISELFTVNDPQTGMKTVVGNPRNVQNKRLWVPIEIVDRDGNKAGEARRYITRNSVGELEVEHSSFVLAPEMQGSGFSSRWLRQMEERYKAAGIKRITVDADDIGGYAWAKAGFDFAEDSDARSMAARADMNAEFDPTTSPEVRKQAAELKRRARAGGDERPTPMEIAMLGWEPGAETWLGKRTMLGANWRGVKEL